MRIEAASDFADLFEVKDALKKKGEYYTRVDDGRLVLGYRRETYVRETWISATGGLRRGRARPHVHASTWSRTASGRPTCT